jgi:hypothetical protein
MHVSRKDTMDLSIGGDQKRTVVGDIDSNPLEGARRALDGDVRTQPDGVLTPAGDNRGDASRLEFGDASPERVSPCEQEYLGIRRVLDERVQADSLHACREMLDPEVQTEAEGDRDPATFHGAGRDLAEDARQLAAIHEHVIGPLQPSGHRAGCLQGVGDGEAGCQGDARSNGGGAAEQHRGEQRRARGGDPLATLATAPRSLLIRKAAETLGRTGSSGTEDDVLRARGAGHTSDVQGGKTHFLTGCIRRHTMEPYWGRGMGVVEQMIQETCVEIGELEARWTSLREARNARRQKIRYIDELIDAFEKLNLADEVEVPYELVGRAVALVPSDVLNPGRSPGELMISEWMDALYEVQDSLMFTAEDDSD